MNHSQVRGNLSSHSFAQGASFFVKDMLPFFPIYGVFLSLEKPEWNKEQQSLIPGETELPEQSSLFTS